MNSLVAIRIVSPMKDRSAFGRTSTTDFRPAAYTRVLNRDAMRLSPKLLLMMDSHTTSLTAADVEVRGVSYPSVTDEALNLTVILDPVTMLPYIVRAYEDHHIFGPSTNDFVVYNYTTLSGLQLPRRMKYMYNEVNMLFDSIIGDVQINPSFTSGYFNGLPLAEVNITELRLPPSPPMASQEYGDAEVFEFRSAVFVNPNNDQSNSDHVTSQNLLWYGGYPGKLSNLTITHPLPGVPKLWHLSFNDAPAVAQTIAEFTDRVMVVDSPPHQSKLVIQWVAENLKKPISHLLVCRSKAQSQHHLAHPDRVADYASSS